MVLILFVQVLKKVLKSLKFELKNPAATLIYSPNRKMFLCSFYLTINENTAENYNSIFMDFLKNIILKCNILYQNFTDNSINLINVFHACSFYLTIHETTEPALSYGGLLLKRENFGI